jgi:hypothetical protein
MPPSPVEVVGPQADARARRRVVERYVARMKEGRCGPEAR